ncbi:hypothetical protein DUZ99_04560 [Xylanibacillus composti]|uniref:Uncharacterized protein n=1 Tax=Xylanibacillus composti TaxID=1572762 RepID=A0A8J4M1W3_9BACL|nr:hypothetical protein [Xylanibacillus composti]MDT9724260.1 hypothetical protein [Xylanibacillus composti]GIQ69255.1 hypothetical protein XYCOK13_20790 [Xylanibacillus composti]
MSIEIIDNTVWEVSVITNNNTGNTIEQRINRGPILYLKLYTNLEKIPADDKTKATICAEVHHYVNGLKKDFNGNITFSFLDLEGEEYIRETIPASGGRASFDVTSAVKGSFIVEACTDGSIGSGRMEVIFVEPEEA